MKRYGKQAVFIVIVLSVIALLGSAAYAAESQTITGTINEDNQLVASDGTVYEIGLSDEGEAVAEMVGQKVTVTGTVEESDGQKIITIIEYEVQQ